MLGACALAIVLVVAVAACGSSGDSSSSAPTTVPVDPTCALTPAAAQRILGAGATATQAAPLGDAVGAPISRCQFQVGSTILQLTVFSGGGMLEQLKTIMGKAEPAPDVGPGAYCEAHQGVTDASTSCVFLNGSDTSVLSLSLPNSDLTPEIQAAVKALATQLAAPPTSVPAGAT